MPPGEPSASLAVLVALSQLTDREREIVIDHFFVGHSFRQIGARQGVAGERIAKIEKRALGKLCALLAPHRAAAMSS